MKNSSLGRGIRSADQGYLWLSSVDSENGVTLSLAEIFFLSPEGGFDLCIQVKPASGCLAVLC